MAKHDDSMMAKSPVPDTPSHILDAMQQGYESKYEDLKRRYREYVDRHAVQAVIDPNIFKQSPANYGKPFACAPETPSIEEYQEHLTALSKVVEWFRCHQALDPLEGHAAEMLDRVIRRAISKTYKDFNP